MDFKLKHALIIYLYVVISAFGSALSASAETDYQTWSLFLFTKVVAPIACAHM
jgi:hypothetical protein